MAADGRQRRAPHAPVKTMVPLVPVTVLQKKASERHHGVGMVREARGVDSRETG